MMQDVHLTPTNEVTQKNTVFIDNASAPLSKRTKTSRVSNDSAPLALSPISEITIQFSSKSGELGSLLSNLLMTSPDTCVKTIMGEIQTTQAPF